MDVAGSRPYCVGQDHVHESDDGWLFPDTSQLDGIEDFVFVFEITLRLALWIHGGQQVEVHGRVSSDKAKGCAALQQGFDILRFGDEERGR